MNLNPLQSADDNRNLEGKMTRPRIDAFTLIELLVNTHPTVRTITVPLGKALFFPIINTFDTDDGTVSHMRDVCKTIIDGASLSDLTCKVDESDVSITAANREQSTPFTFRLPVENIFDDPELAGRYHPAVDDGYYVLLAPLAAGQHTTHFEAILPGSDPLNVTYDITVQ